MTWFRSTSRSTSRTKEFFRHGTLTLSLIKLHGQASSFESLVRPPVRLASIGSGQHYFECLHTPC